MRKKTSIRWLQVCTNESIFRRMELSSKIKLNASNRTEIEQLIEVK